jgi:prolipoprotein diacylglyceryltransferase
MNDMFITLMGRQWYHFTLMLLLSIGGGVLWILWRTDSDHRAQVADVCLTGLISGVVAGRGVHVLIWRDYFAVHPGDILRLTSGGLHPEAALIAGLAGGLLMASLRGVALRPLLDTLALLLPLVSFAGWWGCLTARCAYGEPVPTLSAYPPFLVHEAPDLFGILEPRFATQPVGMWFSAGLVLLALVLHRTNTLPGMRFWLLLCLWSAGSVGISLMRGDTMPLIAGLRLDSWLHLLLMGVSAAGLVWQSVTRSHQTAL